MCWNKVDNSHKECSNKIDKTKSVGIRLIYSYDSIIRPGLIIFKLFENDFSMVLIIESLRIFSDNTYNRDSTYNCS